MERKVDTTWSNAQLIIPLQLLTMLPLLIKTETRMQVSSSSMFLKGLFKSTVQISLKTARVSEVAACTNKWPHGLHWVTLIFELGDLTACTDWPSLVGWQLFEGEYRWLPWSEQKWQQNFGTDGEHFAALSDRLPVRTTDVRCLDSDPSTLENNHINLGLRKLTINYSINC